MTWNVLNTFSPFADPVVGKTRVKSRGHQQGVLNPEVFDLACSA